MYIFIFAENNRTDSDKDLLDSKSKNTSKVHEPQVLVKKDKEVLPICFMQCDKWIKLLSLMSYIWQWYF